MSKALRLRELAIKAYWAAETPKEAKMASILLALFAPDVEAAGHGIRFRTVALPLHVLAGWEAA